MFSFAELFSAQNAYFLCTLPRSNVVHQAATDRDRACAVSDRATDQNLVPKSEDEMEEGE